MPFSSQTSMIFKIFRTPVTVYLYRHLKTKSIWSMAMTFRLNLYLSSRRTTFPLFLFWLGITRLLTFPLISSKCVVLLGRRYCVKHCQVESINRAGRYPFYKLSVYMWTWAQRKGVIVLEDKGKQGRCKCTVI